MSKKIGYAMEIKFDRYWKVVIYINYREQYFYVFDSEEEAIEFYNKNN